MEMIMDKNKKLARDTYKGRIHPLIISFFLIFLGGLMVLCHPQIGYSMYVLILIGIGIVLIGFSSLILFISDLWFVGKKFDAAYYKKVQEAGEKKLRFELPFVSKLPSIRPARTMMYSWGLISKKIQYKPVLGEDDLKANASTSDIILAWLTIGMLVLGFVLLGIGAVLS